MDQPAHDGVHGEAGLWSDGSIPRLPREVGLAQAEISEVVEVESELAAVVKGASEGMGMQAVLADFGLNIGLLLRSDASAAIGICHRQGLGTSGHS